MSDDLDLSRELTRLVSTTPGVLDVYPAGNLAAVLALGAANAIADDDTGDAHVAIIRHGETADIHIAIAVMVDHPVPATLRLVSEVVGAALAASGFDATPSLHVKASRID